MNRARTIAGLAAIGFMVPYIVIKLLWMIGLDIGVNDPELMGSPQMLVANLMTAAMEVVGLLLALALIRPWGMKLPAWLILFPIWVGTGLLIPLMLTVPVTLIAALISGSGDVAPLDDVLQPWVYTVVYGGFIGQGLALAAAFVLYALDRWARPLAARTGDVPVGVTHPLQRLLAWVAIALIGCTVVGQLYAAATSDDRLPMRVGQNVGALFGVVAAVGLLMLVRVMRRQTAFVVSVAMTWVGAGALFSGGIWVIVGVLLRASTSLSLIDGVNLLRLLAGVLAGTVAAFLLLERSAQTSR
ncbi:MAG TPA: hypothetical protein DGG94_12230 [Micromonosporaceae bacterium]|nr:hypothetical protein [Micromonosporaceae bacterium]HCU50549.1 hypothetical protein [Micromonosporaceae bacterium]